MNRQELIQAARGRKIGAAKHLDTCKECREAIRLLKVFDLAGELPLTDAPAPLVERAIAVVAGQGLVEKVRRLAAQLVFDSWMLPRPAGVRGACPSGHRRLRFKARDLIFDVRAERYKSEWICIAQVTGGTDSRLPILLRVGRKQILPDSSGMYQWSAKTPPRKLTFNADDVIIELPELAWQKPRKK